MTEPTPYAIRLDHFVKRSFPVATGGDAKVAIQSGEVSVNGAVETRRRKKLQIGDTVTYAGQSATVTEADARTSPPEDT
jgi:ribosome-associated protein